MKKITIMIPTYNQAKYISKAIKSALNIDYPNAQGTGSAITYARRYALSTFLGIASETDDDGNEATGNRNGKIAKVDKEMEGKQQFLADKSQEFSKKYKINKTTFYASLGQTMGVQDPIDEPLAALVEGAKKLQVKYEEEKKWVDELWKSIISEVK